MGSNPFDVMIDDWSFEIAQLTSYGTGLMSTLFELAIGIFSLFLNFVQVEQLKFLISTSIVEKTQINLGKDLCHSKKTVYENICWFGCRKFLSCLRSFLTLLIAYLSQMDT